MVSEIPLNEIKGCLCAWEGCREEFDGDKLPSGWRVLVIARGPLFDTQNLINADRDAVLCPKHFKQIDSLLKSI